VLLLPEFPDSFTLPLFLLVSLNRLLVGMVFQVSDGPCLGGENISWFNCRFPSSSPRK